MRLLSHSQPVFRSQQGTPDKVQDVALVVSEDSNLFDWALLLRLTEYISFTRPVVADLTSLS